MASITASGIGSGLDINSIVSQLVSAERAPQQNRLDAKEALIQARLSAYGTLKSALAEFQTSLSSLKDSATFAKRTANSSDTSVFTATASSGASAGNYSVQVEQLAARHKIASAAYDGSESVVGSGSLTVSANGESFTLAIAEGEDSLAAIRDAINNAEDNFGVSASIVTDQDGAHLVLSAAQTGLENQLTVAVTSPAGASGDLSQLAFDAAATSNPMVEKSAARNAIVIVDGFTQTSPTNEVAGMTEGLTLNLKAAKPGEPFELTVSRDTATARKAIQSFVDNYNKLIGIVDDLTAYDPEAKTAGLLQGDSTTRNVASRLRQEISAATVGARSEIDTLAELGLTTTETGALKIDSDTLADVLDADFDNIASIFTGDSGYAGRLDRVIANLTDDDGILSTRTEGLENQVERISEQREALDRRISAIEQRYVAQFTALDSLLGQLNSTGEFLNQQLANLPGVTKNSG